MIKELAVAGIGIGIGVCVAYQLNENRKKRVFEYKKEGEKLNELKDFEELLKEQVVVDVLDGKEVADWFRKNIDFLTEGVNQFLAYPTSDILNGLGYQYNEEINPQKNVIQFYYDNNISKVKKLRFISFSVMDNKLQILLNENNGIAIIE